jgi:periplasmic protein TonB
MNQSNDVRVVSRLGGLVVVAGAFAVQAAAAQFATLPAPRCEVPHESSTDDVAAYRIEAARHLYSCYPTRVYHGRMPPLLYGVMVIEVDSAGKVLDVSVIRGPAADEVAPWVVAMVKGAAPFPNPVRLPGQVAQFSETFFVVKSGQFQTLSLTEGQRDR